MLRGLVPFIGPTLWYIQLKMTIWYEHMNTCGIMEAQSSLFFVTVAVSSSWNVYQVRTILQTTVESFNAVISCSCSIPCVLAAYPQQFVLVNVFAFSYDSKNALLAH